MDTDIQYVLNEIEPLTFTSSNDMKLWNHFILSIPRKEPLTAEITFWKLPEHNIAKAKPIFNQPNLSIIYNIKPIND